MSKLKFWVFWTFVSAVGVGLINSLTFNYYSIFGTSIHLSWGLILNWVGVIFGMPAFILWLGRRAPYSDRFFALMMSAGFLLFIGSRQLEIISVQNPILNLSIMMFFVGVGSMVFCLRSAICHFRRVPQTDIVIKEKNYLAEFLLLAVLLLSLTLVTTDSLAIISVIFPKTLDYDVYKIDAAFHHLATSITILNDQLPAFWQTVIAVTYDLLPFGLYCFVGLLLRDRKGDALHVWRFLVIPFGVGFLLYFINPVSGPTYAFPSDRFPYHMLSMDNIPVGAGFTFPAPRNGMPSMHFAGALLICLATVCLKKKVFFYCSCVFAALTFFATMGIGEHYLIDLIVAVPFAAAMGTALLNPRGWQFWRRRSWWGSAICFVIWEFLLRCCRGFLIDHLLFVQLFSCISTVFALVCFYEFGRFVWTISLEQDAEITIIRQQTIRQENAYPCWVLGLFVASGFAGLLYEVVFAKNLGVTFGGTSLAAYTVMATYMGGMALGAWLGGVVADRVRSPLKWYAVFEGTIGLYALLTPALFKLIEHFYVYVATDIRPDAGVLTLWRVVLGAAVLGIPTLLMGTTLPIMFKYLRHYLPNRGKVIANLYTANIMGAALGALIGGYVVLPTLGLRSATHVAALISLMISLYALDKLKRQKPITGVAADEGRTEPAAKPDLCELRQLGLAALLVVTVGGIVTLALEIVNMHMLAIIAGNSVYAFGLMLATFLLGLGLGSFCYNQVRPYIRDALIAAFAQLGIFITIIISGFQWDGLADYFSGFEFFLQFYQYEFGAREIIRAGVCAIIMIPPAFFIGLGYPATMALSSAWLKQKNGRDAGGVGIASLCNTVGNILGVLLAGFLLLNWLGSNRLLLILALVSLGLAILMFIVSYPYWSALLGKTKYKYSFIAGLTIMSVFALVSYPSTWNLDTLSTGGNVYFVPMYRGEVIDSKESIEGGLTTVNKADNTLTLLTNGKFQGNNSGETAAQRAFALIPLLHTPKRESVLVIGYGTGNSAHVLHGQSFKNIDIVELSKDIVSMADKHFGNINGLVSQQDNVNVYYTDGRNFLLTQKKKYDLISIEISSIWFAGAANLYNREFYQLAKKRLNKGGVLQQWVQLHHIRLLDLVYIINTMNQEFKYVWLYFNGGQGILVASNAADGIDKLYNLDRQLVSDIKDLNQEEKALFESNILTPEDVNYISRSLVVPQYFTSTDNNLYLEYATPKGNAISDNTVPYNIEKLESIARHRKSKKH